MTVDVLLFAGVREAAKSDRVAIDVPPGASYAELLRQLAAALPAARAAIESSRLAADGEFVDMESVVRHDVEIALIPPVSGG